MRGVVFGEMLNCVQHVNQGYTLEEVLVDLLDEFQFPIFSGSPLDTLLDRMLSSRSVCARVSRWPAPAL